VRTSYRSPSWGPPRAFAGGKAANLGEALGAGLPVPDGFCVTTRAYAEVAEASGLGVDVGALAAAGGDERDRRRELAAGIRARVLATAVPDPVRDEIVDAYRARGVRQGGCVDRAAGATASFARQQDTYLDVVGAQAVVDAVRRCWASLWTDRAVEYRAANGIDSRAVRLAVVVQRMVDARVAGVLFTANPLTGRRYQAVIDAAPGLGDRIVSGAVNPDHFVVDTASGAIVERRAAATPCLTDAELRRLAAIGARVEAVFGAPQDVEFAIDRGGGTWVTQARPITTLYPLPDPLPDGVPGGTLRVYFSFNVAQGVYRPLTPMGVQALRMFGTSMTRLAGPPADPAAVRRLAVEAGQRLFLDVTPVLRNPLGRRFLLRAATQMEAQSSAILRTLVRDDHRLAPTPTPQWRTAATVARVFGRTRIPQRAAIALARPEAARERAAGAGAAALTFGDVAADATASERLDAFERLLLDGPALLWPSVIPPFLAGVVANVAAARLLRGLATDTERRLLTRGLPHNPTTEMDLALWRLAEQLRDSERAARALRDVPLHELAASYRQGTLPPALQRPLAEFLRRYGHRGVAEIDLGVPRWSEDPTHLLAVLANFRRHDDPTQAPDTQFRRAEQQAEAMVAELGARAARAGWLRGVLVRFFLRRLRELFGQREAPKSSLVRLFARGRALLTPVGEELARAGRLDRADDVFFLDLAEARAGLAGRDLRALVRDRRAAYDRELRRRHVPRVLLSDGTEPAPARPDAPLDGALVGTAASPGTVTATARVLRDPADARLDQGQILVAPSTDPGWTPLFLTAGGLVMEMGGAMSHGAVVAREYGIPAVVGVLRATERIADGQTVTVDGTAGLVHLATPRCI
jgi:pyruvate,water dikinase